MANLTRRPLLQRISHPIFKGKKKKKRENVIATLKTVVATQVSCKCQSNLPFFSFLTPSMLIMTAVTVLGDQNPVRSWRLDSGSRGVLLPSPIQHKAHVK